MVYESWEEESGSSPKCRRNENREGERRTASGKTESEGIRIPAH